MARERMVTRTIKVTEVELMVVDVQTAEVRIETHTLTGQDFTNETALTFLKKGRETDKIKCVTATIIKEYEELFGMPEWEFLECARKLDKNTRK